MGEDGVGHFYGHAPRSAELADDIMARLRFDNESRERVLTLVRHHDGPLEADAKFLKRKLSKLGEKGFFDLVALCRADNMAQAKAYRYRQLHYDEVYRPVELDGATAYALNGTVRSDIKQSEDYEKLTQGYATVTVLHYNMTDLDVTNVWNALV